MTLFYKKYNENILNYDFLNKFKLKNVTDLPAVTNIILTFNFKTYNYDLLIKGLVTLEVITESCSHIIKSKNSNTTLKLKKGSPIGCKINLKKKKASKFLFFFINNSQLTDVTNKTTIDKFYSVNLVANALSFPELQENYHFFKDVGNFNIKIFTTAKNKKELNYLLDSYKL